MDDSLKSGIYCIENKLSNKKYIGQSIDVYTRMRKHFNDLKRNTHKNSHLQSSWNRHGQDNFKFYVLEYCGVEELDNKEVYYINYYNTINNKFGYNYKTGGQNGGSRYSDESRKKMSESQKRVCENPEWIKHLSENALKIWSNEEYKKNRSGENHPLYGKHLTDEHRSKIGNKLRGVPKPKRSKKHCEAISRAKKGKKSPKRNTTPVRCVETGQIFCDAITAGKEMNLKYPNMVISVCNGRQQTTQGYHFEFIKNKEEE